ncbi:MAG: TonB-dependent receptor plug domain-containing protein, partial [Kiritimatiellia bacterium]
MPIRSKKPTLKTVFLSGILLTELAGRGAFAEPEPVEELQNLVVSGQSLHSDQVTALKSPTLILNVPQSLSIITAERIQDQGFSSIHDLVDYTPGVTTSQGENHRD